MKHRNPFLVFFFPFITFGIYTWYWLISTKNEMNKRGASIPTAWLWLIPFFGGLWWYWRYSEGVEKVTNAKMSGILVFLLFILIGSIGHAIVQDSFNKIGTTPVAPQPTVPNPAQVASTPSAPQQPQSNS